MASNIMLLLLLLTFSLVNAKAMPPPESSRDEHGHTAFVQRRDRDLLSRTIDGMQPDAVVSKDGSGGGHYYTTISAAIAEAPAGSKRRYVIHVRKGTYEENVEITRPKHFACRRRSRPDDNLRQPEYKDGARHAFHGHCQ